MFLRPPRTRCSSPSAGAVTTAYVQLSGPSNTSFLHTPFMSAAYPFRTFPGLNAPQYTTPSIAPHALEHKPADVQRENRRRVVHAALVHVRLIRVHRRVNVDEAVVAHVEYRHTGWPEVLLRARVQGTIHSRWPYVGCTPALNIQAMLSSCNQNILLSMLTENKQRPR